MAHKSNASSASHNNCIYLYRPVRGLLYKAQLNWNTTGQVNSDVTCLVCMKNISDSSRINARPVNSTVMFRYSVP
jgi:hypothetical protein